MTQQARNLVWDLKDAGVEAAILIRDRDSKFTPAGDAIFSTHDVRVIRTPVRAPQANAYAERWVGTVRRECLDWLLILGRRHLERVLGEYMSHYNRARPHRALQLQPPLTSGQAVAPVGPIRRRDLLGDFIHEYARQVARHPLSRHAISEPHRLVWAPTKQRHAPGAKPSSES